MIYTLIVMLNFHGSIIFTQKFNSAAECHSAGDSLKIGLVDHSKVIEKPTYLCETERKSVNGETFMQIE